MFKPKNVDCKTRKLELKALQYLKNKKIIIGWKACQSMTDYTGKSLHDRVLKRQTSSGILCTQEHEQDSFLDEMMD